MSKTKNTTKTGNLSQEFKSMAVLNGDGALCYMLMAAFGVSLSVLMGIATKAIATKDASLVILAMTAAVQIRNHVVFVGADHGGIKVKYPELIIEGSRDQTDQFNFGALHALGHIFAHLTGEALGRKVLTKAGSCITGEYVNDSPAGVINKEIHSGWTGDDVVAWGAWNSAKASEFGPVLNPIVASMQQRATEFAKQLSGKPKVPAPPAGMTATKTEGV